MTSLERMPTLFIGHGNPMNAIEDTEYARAWKNIGASLRRPKAVLAISAHWYVEGTFVTAMAKPRTIHDFAGFPAALHDVRYPAPGDPELVQRLALRASLLPDAGWGFDHCAWSVLRRLFPDADTSVAQLSLDEAQPPSFHHELGRELGAPRCLTLSTEASAPLAERPRTTSHRVRNPTSRWRQNQSRSDLWCSRVSGFRERSKMRHKLSLDVHFELAHPLP